MNSVEKLEEKINKLEKCLSILKSVVVAFSGGVDSTFLLKVAQDVLGSNVLAVIASSATYPASEQQEALRIAEELKVKYKVMTNRIATNGSRDCSMASTMSTISGL